MPLALLTSGMEGVLGHLFQGVFLSPVFARLDCGGVLRLDFLYISRPCLPAALG